MKDVKTLFETEPYTEEVFRSFLADSLCERNIY